MWKVDLTAYVERHEFCFDAVLDEQVTNDEVILQYFVGMQDLLSVRCLSSFSWLYTLDLPFL